MASNAAGGDWGFRVRYEGESGASTSVHVHVGSERAPDEDHQLVFITDGRLHFSVRAHVWEGLLTDVEFFINAGQPRSLEQRDLRTSGLVKLIYTWAQLGRQHQLSRRSADPLGGAMIELSDHVSLDEALVATSAQLNALLPPADAAERKRLRGRQADELVARVAKRYQELVEKKHRNPRQKIAEEEGYTPEHIGRLLMKARRPPYSLLGPATPGKAGESGRPGEPSAGAAAATPTGAGHQSKRGGKS